MDDDSNVDDETADAVVAAGMPWVESSQTIDELELVGEAAGEDALEGCAFRPAPIELAEAEADALALAEATTELEAEAEAETGGLTAQDLFLLRTSFFPSRLKPAEFAIESASLGGRPKCALGYDRSSTPASSRLNPATPLRSDDEGGMPK